MADKVIKLFIAVILCVLLASCKYATVPSYIKNINFNFSEKRVEKMNGKGYFKDTIANNFINIFYDKNICVFVYLGGNDKKIDERFQFIKSNSNHYFYQGGANTYWGTYMRINDTLKVKIVNRPSLFSPTWMAYEEWYKIIDANTIKQIAYKQIRRQNDTSRISNQEMIFLKSGDSQEKKFHENSGVPNYNKSWLLKHEWFWNNKKDYKEWKSNGSSKSPKNE